MPVDDNWSEHFFEGPWIDLHLSFRSPSDVQRETDAILSLLQPSVGARIVDIPCGPGDHVVELARRGFQVTGVDRSAALLEHARRRARKAQVTAEFVTGDMRAFRTDAPFDILTCMWGSFGYFDAAGDQAQLHTFHELIRPGGQLLLDLLPLEGILFNFEPRDSQRVGRMIVVQDRSYDMQRQRIDGTWTFHRDDERIERQTSMRLYTVRETLEMLDAAGFSDVAMLDPETLDRFELGAIRTWVRARRR
jgi:SAM-dependent methyltransferase